MSKFIRALALFSLTIGLAGCFHSDDDTVFVTELGTRTTVTVTTPVTVTGPTTGPTVTVEVIDTGDIAENLSVFVTGRQAGVDIDGDGIPDFRDTDDDGDGIPDATDTDFTDADGNGIDDTVEANTPAPSLAEVSTDGPIFPVDGIRSSEPTNNARSAQLGIVDSADNTRTRTPTNIIYRPRADLGLVEFNSDGAPPDRRVIPQIAAYEVINSREDTRRYAYYGEADSAESLSETAYFTEQGALMEFAALAYWIDSPSDALGFSTDQTLSEIGAGVFGLETAPTNLPRGIASYRGTMHGIYRKSTPTEITTSFTIRPENVVDINGVAVVDINGVAVNRNDDLSDDLIYPVVLRTGAQNYLVEGPVNVTAEFALGRIDGGFTAMAYEPNYRLDYTPESLADYDPTAERNDETFGQWLGNGRYYLPNRGGLRVAPAGIIAIPTIPVLDPVSGSPTFDINRIPIRADAVVLPTTTALDGSGNPIRAGVDPQGVQILDPAAQIAIRYSPLSGTTRTDMVSCTSGFGCMTNAGSTCTPTDSGCTRAEDVWVPDDDAALAIRRSLANTLPDPFTRLPAPVPVIPSVLQGQFSGSIDRSVDDGEFTGEFTGTTSIGVSVTTTGGTVARDVSEVVFATRADIVAANNANANTFTFGFLPIDDSRRTRNQPREPRNINQLVPLNRRILDEDGNFLRIEAVTNDADVPLFIVIRTASRQVPETTEEAIEPTGVFSPLADATGDIFGQFFGPNGEETAGSGNLQNGQNELVFTFGGRQIGLIPPDTLTPEDAAQIAEQTRLNGRYDELVSLILPDFERTDAPAFSPVLNNQRLTNIDAFNEEQTENALRLFYPATVPIEDIRILNELSRTFRMNSGIVDDPMVLDMIDPTGRLTP